MNTLATMLMAHASPAPLVLRPAIILPLPAGDLVARPAQAPAHGTVPAGQILGVNFTPPPRVEKVSIGPAAIVTGAALAAVGGALGGAVVGAIAGLISGCKRE